MKTSIKSGYFKIFYCSKSENRSKIRPKAKIKYFKVVGRRNPGILRKLFLSELPDDSVIIQFCSICLKQLEWDCVSKSEITTIN